MSDLDISALPLPKKRAPLRKTWQRVRDWVVRNWQAIRPGPEARRGAIWAAVTTACWALVVGAWNLNLGFGLWADFVFVLLVAAIGIPLVALAVALVFSIVRSLPRWTSGLIVGTFLFVSLLWFGSIGYWVGLILVLVECSLGASLGTILLGGLRGAALSKRIITITICVLALAANVAIVSLLHNDGVDEELIHTQQNAASLPPRLNVPNPSSPGPHAIRTLFYGAGNDLRRPEYGPSVAIRTGTLDAAPLFKDFGGWKAWVRRAYWGFGMDKLPLNGRVWYPEGTGPFPLVLIVHGNHEMSQFSDPGYAYLGELFASRGFILASIDENFLNVGLFHDPPKQQAVRGWMLLEHLKLWHNWNAAPGNPFYRKVDLENVALMGHSRGGEAAATAALFNKLAYYPDDANIRFHYGFPIKSVVAIAPADGQYKPAGQWRMITDVNYFTIQGANDADVSSFMGSRQWDHVHFSGNGSYFKAELYVYRANHGQFNTVWGRTDSPAPSNWLLNLRPLLSGDQQRNIAKLYLSAFLEATLHNRREYLPLFQDYRRGRHWLPDTLYAGRYADQTNKIICDYSEDADLTTTTAPGGHLESADLTVWREGKIPFRNGDRDYNGVFLGWNSEKQKKTTKSVPAYSVTLPENLSRDWTLNAQSMLTLSAAVTEEAAPSPDKQGKAKDKQNDADSEDKPETTDFTVEMETHDGAIARLPLSRFLALLPPIKVRFTKLEPLDKLLYKNESEPVFQSVELPLSAFIEQNNHFDPAKLKTVRLVFDRTPSRVIIVREIGFSNARN